MALPSTVHTLDVTLAHVDRGVYETLAFRMARHPSETAEYFVARLLAYCLTYEEGIAFSRGGLSDPDEPPLAVRDLTGTMRGWIERTFMADLYVSSDGAQSASTQNRMGSRTWRAIAGDPAAIRVHVLDRALVAALAERLDRRWTLTVTVTDGTLYVELGGAVFTGTVTTGGVHDADGGVGD